jgi:hypothetical protein
MEGNVGCRGLTNLFLDVVYQSFEILFVCCGITGTTGLDDLDVSAYRTLEKIPHSCGPAKLRVGGYTIIEVRARAFRQSYASACPKSYF